MIRIARFREGMTPTGLRFWVGFGKGIGMLNRVDLDMRRADLERVKVSGWLREGHWHVEQG